MPIAAGTATREPDWPLVGVRLGALLILVVGCAALSARTFRAYQRSI